MSAAPSALDLPRVTLGVPAIGVMIGASVNALRPVPITKGADLPLVLILSGVIGGVLAFGVIGLFVGPVLLAVTWTLLDAWVGDIDGGPDPLALKGQP